MPRYEYRCRTCGDTFELSRPMAESAAPADCPAGHDDTVKLLSTVAVATGGSASAPSPGPSAGGGGGCCGGGCCG
ncbi:MULTISPECIES: FmdB family zinc ribbon protein [Streptomyces]|uniref:Zinc ribbon domain-containing protein n=2 Tax=Streptomyces TaxID=1883 RepID=A0ABU3UUR7_9ACTN|nr:MULTISPECIES: zinc ribbon domain-containing protein [Streptomyces]KAF6000148.1 FmdB family transcriptional regulator [Streptomyces sp. WAC00263]MCX4424499.1 zinc ribbon domain-containing protein [Streptomyces mirabilis]MCX4608454.1 zinc ribbon domain-containing protein [Streptomyces mirabilis]MCX5348938.1 zinc ribbon domain-containing protein [Streptomyces mirabilis]MDU8997668.1 zinc ribbon domain-containing protein [Streptomyces mirabilis]